MCNDRKLRTDYSMAMTLLAAGFIGTVLFACGGAGSGPSASAIAATQQIVFMEQVKPNFGAQGFELVVMDLDGSNRRQLTDNAEQEFLPHFSPNGTRLLYTRFTKGGYGVEASLSRVTVYDFATGTTRDLSDTGKDSYPAWSPDGTRIAFLSTRDGYQALWVMNADGSGAREIGHPSGPDLDFVWGDIVWSSQDWILFVVAENVTNGACFKTRLDKIRPDGTARTKVSDGGPNCTPLGKEQSGDADPGVSADGMTIYSSRGFPVAPVGASSGITERRLYRFSSDAWYQGKPEHDLSLAAAPSCVEGVPKGSPDGTRILLFRACFDGGATSQPGIYVTDTSGSYRTRVASAQADGSGVPAVFGPNWNPAWKP